MLFEFNQWSALLLPFFLQGILFTLLLLWRGFKEASLSDKLLAILLFIFSLRIANWMLGFAFWYDAHDWHSTFMFYFPFNNWFLIGPLSFFYFKSLTNQSFRFTRKDILHFIPAFLDWAYSFIVFFADVVVSYWWYEIPFPHHYGTQGKWRMEGIFWIDALLLAGAVASMLTYFLITIRQYRAYRVSYVEEYFSDTDKVAFTWVRNFLYAVVIAIFIWLTFFLIDFLGQPLTYIQFWYAYFAWGIIIYYLSISGYYTRLTPALKLHFEPQLPTELPPVQEPVIDVTLQQTLLQVMEKQKPYLQPELTLHDLANLLEVSAPKLSKTIHLAFDKNFNDFINSYRVEAVKQKLLHSDFEHLSLLGVALECGFNSKATFNRAFRKHTGIAPSAFLLTKKETSA